MRLVLGSRRTLHGLLLILLARGVAAQDAPHALALATLFSDGMVVQRGARTPVWGWAVPRTPVVVRFEGRTARSTSDSAGRWAVSFPPSAAGGPYTLSVDAAGQHATVADIMVGDVWVASGQSNMEFPLSLASNAATTITSAHDSLIREFKVPISWSKQPSDDLAGGSWAPADPQHVGAFSAVAYFFARDLRAAEHAFAWARWRRRWTGSGSTSCRRSRITR